MSRYTDHGLDQIGRGYEIAMTAFCARCALHDVTATGTTVEAPTLLPDDWAEALVRHTGGTPESCSDLLCSYACDHADGYSEGFAAWLRKVDAAEEELNSMVNAAAKADDADEVARHLIVQRPEAISTLAAFRAEPRSETFAAWAWRQLEQAAAE